MKTGCLIQESLRWCLKFECAGGKHTVSKGLQALLCGFEDSKRRPAETFDTAFGQVRPVLVFCRRRGCGTWSGCGTRGSGSVALVRLRRAWARRRARCPATARV